MDSNGQWNGSIEVKLDTQDSSFKGSGNYNFKIGGIPFKKILQESSKPRKNTGNRIK